MRFTLSKSLLPVAAGTAVLMASCSVPRIDPVDPARSLGSISISSRASLWPSRNTPTVPPVEVKKGVAPTDEGTFGKCRVLHAGELKRGTALLIAGVRDRPLSKDEEPFKLGITSPKRSTELEISTRAHRVTLAILKPARTAQPRGLVIYLSSIMLISAEERRFLRKLEERGWNVAAITPSLNTFAEDQWPETWKEEETDKQARMLASELDDQLAEAAFAAEALLGYLRKKRPSWLEGPRVVIGSSAGSFAAPALIKRTGRPDALVFIGAGVDVPEVLFESQLEIYQPEVELRDSRGASSREIRQRKEAARRQFKDLALKHSRLDPLHHLPALRTLPTLMLSAERDRIVPSHTGELLYRGLGEPERWRFQTGHVLLFLNLPFQAGRIADWMDRHVPSP